MANRNTFYSIYYYEYGIPVIVAEPEPPGAATFRQLRSRSRFCFGSEPGAGAALFKAAPAPAAFFRQAKKKSLVLVSNMTLQAVEKGKYGPK